MNNKFIELTTNSYELDYFKLLNKILSSRKEFTTDHKKYPLVFGEVV